VKVRSTWNLESDPALLDYFARGPIEYEVRMLLQQFGHLEHRRRDVRRRRRRDAAADLGADGQALLEAVLVHLRLLDEFLGDPRQTKRRKKADPDDVFACHWDRRRHPRWKPKRFLGDDRQKLNARLAHLTGRRLKPPDVEPDDLPPLVLKCCERLNEFFDHVDAHNHARVTAFACPRERVRQFLASDPRAVA
jgi:hypothetical protein